MRRAALAAAILLPALLLVLLRPDLERLKLSLQFSRMLGAAETSREIDTLGALAGHPECVKAIEQAQIADTEELNGRRRIIFAVSFLCESEQEFMRRAENRVEGRESFTSLEAARIAEQLIENNDVDGAISVLSAHPEVAQRLVNLGRIEIEYNNDEQSAIRYFAAANGLDPSFSARKSPMYLYLCLYAIREDENIVLENPCEDLYRARPNATSRGLFARRFLMEGQFEEAETLLREATLAQDVSGETYFWLGNALKLQERNAEARDAFEQGIELAPGYAQNYMALGELLVENGCLSKARQVLDSATAADTSSEVASTVASIGERIGDEPAEDQECQLETIP